MLNKEILIKKIKDCGMTLESFAVELGINYTTLYRKIKGESDFTRAEVQKTRIILQLTTQEADAIFFDEQLA